jgi:hypothetical protein
MSTYPSIPATVEIKRGRFIGLVVAVAVLAAAVTGIVVAFAFDNGSSTAGSNSKTSVVTSASSAAQDARKVTPIMSLTAADLAANALGTGYAVPSAQKEPSVESVLASMSPQTREYTKRIMNLTFAQLGAGAAGQP